MSLHDVAYQREPQSAALGVMHQRIADPVELLENFELLFERNADSVIDDLEVDATVAAVQMDAEIFLCGRVLHGIVYKIQQRTSNRLTIHPQWRKIVVDLLLEVEAVLLNFKTIGVERAPHQIGHVGFAEAVLFLARLDAGEVKNIVDQRSQPLALFANDLVVFLMFARGGDASQLQSFCIKADERKGCSELVRDIGNEIRFQFRQCKFAGEASISE